MSDIIEDINNETSQFKDIIESYNERGYYEGRNACMRLLRKEFNELESEIKKADSFDSAILSVLIGYLKKMHKDMSLLKYEGVE